MSGGKRSDLGEWVAYLAEIGVRDIRAPAPGAKVTGRPEPVVKAAGKPSKPVKQMIIGDGFDSPPPEDPAKRLAEIRDDIGDCTRCKLCEKRTNIVFGVGNPGAGLMFIGEGPGADEDAQGEPFVGRAGKKLDEMIKAIKLEREEVYIANIVKCRPPRNRDPEKDEIATCVQFLYDQIEAIRPKVIVTLGAPAARTLLNTKIGITKIRGEWHTFRGIDVMPTFHPAYLLRAYTYENRSKVYADLQAARERMDEQS